MNLEIHIQNEFKKVSSEIETLTESLNSMSFFMTFSKKHKEINARLDELHIQWHVLFSLMTYNPNIPLTKPTGEYQ